MGSDDEEETAQSATKRNTGILPVVDMITGEMPMLHFTTAR